MHKSYILTRGLFLRLLGLIYLIAFISVWIQIEGLIGSEGILPAHLFLEQVYQRFEQRGYWILPTLLWFDASDATLHLLCGAGVTCSVLFMVGILPPLMAVLQWAFYLSIVTAGRDFMSFQWDILLLEVGFLAIFFAPWKLFARFSDEQQPHLSMIWLYRLLLFKLMFLSGFVKLSSGDEAWYTLSALQYHYETQPLPTIFGWYAHQFPEAIQKVSVALMFVVELIVPFLIFLPRLYRKFAFFTLIGFQCLILITGNYCFFNILTICLCIPLLDDAFWRSVFPTKVAERLASSLGTEQKFFGKRYIPILFFALVMLTLNLLFFFNRKSLPVPFRKVIEYVAPFGSVNRYGLFAVMTKRRDEIIVEGSLDGKEWHATFAV